jgi:hypothetical protein
MKRTPEECEAMRDYYEERAAILEFCAHMSRGEAERRAREEAVARLREYYRSRK